MKKLAILICFPLLLMGQNYSKIDSLVGGITPERAWWDVVRYDLDVEVFPESKSISGKNTISYIVTKKKKDFQIELQEPLKVLKITQNSKELKYNKVGYSYFIKTQTEQPIGSKQKITVYYKGVPRVGKRLPWKGGFTWQKDSKGDHFIATACQLEGASSWWPCKEHPADEVNNMGISITCPSPVIDVSNGRLLKTTLNPNKTSTYLWEVYNPINNYGVNINIADYAHFSEIYKGEKGNLTCNYYVLKENLEKAKVHFKDATRTLEAFEYWFGPYPFYEDGYKLVEVPYLGMEHQSSVTYGNKYLKGYRGKGMGKSKWGLKFDYIIVHETGHEWFANNITHKDVADMWIHEAFTTYSENLFLDYHYSKQAACEYVIGTRGGIKNKKAIQGPYHVHKEGSGDMYNKGSNMLHTLRFAINDDILWRQILRGLNKEFYHKTVSASDVENYIDSKVPFSLKGFFNQYIRGTEIPKLVYYFKDNKIYYKWESTVANFTLPIKVKLDKKDLWLTPTDSWQELKTKCSSIIVDPNFYINTEEKQ